MQLRWLNKKDKPGFRKLVLQYLRPVRSVGPDGEICAGEEWHDVPTTFED